jgi:hypothetical protein
VNNVLSLSSCGMAEDHLKIANEGGGEGLDYESEAIHRRYRVNRLTPEIHVAR